MSMSKNAGASPKEVVKAIYAEVFNTRDVAPLDRYLTPDFIDHNPDPGQPPGLEGVKISFANLFKAFPDVQVINDQILVDGNMVTVRSTISGTQKGEFVGMPASNKTFRVTLIDIIEVKDGKATQRWGLLDFATMMQQLGPAPGPANP